jgi:hypothetical protein
MGFAPEREVPTGRSTSSGLGCVAGVAARSRLPECGGGL